MADVLIVCVREDEPQAKALADMFEAAGFSIGGAPSSEAGLRSSGAGVVVWSQASIRSRPFLDAAQRVINANKAVVASLIEPPPPSSIGDAPAFDLSGWDGDPNDPALDPLFFAVDRMVNAARAGVAAAPAAEPPAAYEAAPPRPEPPRRAPPPPPAQAQPASYRTTSPAADPLGSEAEHWRAIRDSRNPADFMDYLARYGPDGAFSEVAELRLKQLTAAGESRAPAARAAPRPAPPARPAMRAEPQPRRVEPPTPTRRPEPAPLRRDGALTARRPMIERTGFDRGPEMPPKGEGGPLRAFVIIALLGGAALAGGLYFGGMGGFGGSGSNDDSTEAAAGAPVEPSSEFSALEEAPSVPLSDVVGDERPVQVASRQEPTPPPAPTTRRNAESEQPPQPSRTASSTPTGATSRTSANLSGSGGPVSLVPPGSSPGATTPSGGAATPAPATPPPLVTAPSSTSASATPLGPEQLRGAPGSVSWAQRPSARRIAELYPQRALREGVGGRVQLDCIVQVNLALTCRVASETPAGEGFGRAALSASSAYRARATLSDGASAVGASTRIAVNFQAPQQ